MSHLMVFDVAAMLFAYALWCWHQNPTYTCPQCGTGNPREHAADCTWAKHYD